MLHFIVATFVTALKAKGYSCVPEDTMTLCMEIIEAASMMLANMTPRRLPSWTIPSPGELPCVYEPDLPAPITGLNHLILINLTPTCW